MGKQLNICWFNALTALASSWEVRRFGWLEAVHFRSWPFAFRKKAGGAVIWALTALWLAPLARGAETNLPTTPLQQYSEEVITNLSQYYNLSADKKNRLHRLHLELMIYYSNPIWNVFWGRSGESHTFLPLKGIPVDIKSGQKILIDGLVLPVNQEIEWGDTKVTILSETNPIAVVKTAGQLLNNDLLDRRMVEINGLVDSLQRLDAHVLQLDLLTGNQSINVYINLDGDTVSTPDLIGKYIQLQGVYTYSTDAFERNTQVTLWSPGLNLLRITGQLEDDPHFAAPLVSSRQFSELAPDQLVRVAGIVRSQTPGESVAIWDAAGRILISTHQQTSLQIGDSLEAVGYPTVRGFNRQLQNSTFRRASEPEKIKAAVQTGQTNLFLTEQVREMDRDQLTGQKTVQLEGVVTRVDERRHFCFILDSSGGIRVMQSALKSGRRLQTGMLVQVTGTATAGDFAPVITNATLNQIGTMTLPAARPASLEEALTGTLDGDLVQMSGYVRQVLNGANALELTLVTPGGEFLANLPREDAFKNLQGSTLQISGVCMATANKRHQLTGITVWVSDQNHVQITRSAIDDPFALPVHSIASLQQYNLSHALNEPVHTRGTVTLHHPGHSLYLQDGNHSVLALSDQTQPLHPGEHAEVVGYPGRGETGYVLREAVYFRTPEHSEVLPVKLSRRHQDDADLNGLLVQVEGVLLETVELPEKTQLVLQSEGLVFEAEIDQQELSPHLRREKFPPNTRLALTGLYFSKPANAAFLIGLRSWNDVKILQSAPWWTPARLLLLLAGIMIALALASFRAYEADRRNQALQKTRNELQTARDKLEERVRERTQELQDQITARQRAHERLADAQERLMLASRQAGMAEIATGVLHNVGNVLNSVNVSAAMINDSLARLRIEQFQKAAALLAGQGDQIIQFLTADPRGKALPGYLSELADNMSENQHQLQDEVKSLIKQIDHIKAIVSLQQNYSRFSSLQEKIDPLELMEDAVQINHAGLERYHIEIARDFQPTPNAFGDRHKTLQILINLLSNAKYAVKDNPDDRRRITLRLRLTPEPMIRFEVTDSGVGIAPENIDRIFNLGFTTKPTGHGFGLHSGANAAQEMNGRLLAQSNGLGCGATFILELPPVPKNGSLSASPNPPPPEP
jgi:signal transduction histidine kinase